MMPQRCQDFHQNFMRLKKTVKSILQVFNCPFKELAIADPDVICTMHNAFLMGMFESVFENVEIKEFENMFSQCELLCL